MVIREIFLLSLFVCSLPPFSSRRQKQHNKNRLGNSKSLKKNPYKQPPKESEEKKPTQNTKQCSSEHIIYFSSRKCCWGVGREVHFSTTFCHFHTPPAHLCSPSPHSCARLEGVGDLSTVSMLTIFLDLKSSPQHTHSLLTWLEKRRALQQVSKLVHG